MNNDIDNVDILPLESAGYSRIAVDQNNTRNAYFKNGRLVYLILDVDKPGKYFFDLRPVFNASTGEGGKTLPILFMDNNVPFDLNNKSVQIHGWYPDKVDFHVTGAANQAQSSLITFNFPQGLFQKAGIYKFQFEIFDHNGNCQTSQYCFFQVTPNATTMAFDWNNGVNPYDSDYIEWKNQVEQAINALTDKMNNLNTSADQLEQLMNNYIAKAQQYVDAAWQKKLDTENTWTAKQHFNGGITFGNNAQGDNLVANTVDTTNLKATGNVDLPQTTTFGGFGIQYFLHVQNLAPADVHYLNQTAVDNQGQTTWLWAARYLENGFGNEGWPTYHIHMCFWLDCSDVGKPFAQFENGFFKGANNGPIVVPCQGGTVQFHIDPTEDTLVLDQVCGLSGKISLGGTAWT